MAHVNLGNLFLESGELAAAREHYEAALSIDAKFAEAHQGLGNLLAELGQEEAAAQHQRLGHWDRRPTELPYRGEAEPVSLLLLSFRPQGRRSDPSFVGRQNLPDLRRAAERLRSRRAAS